MSRIRLLSSEVINQIAAGEVVERPASVVKELVENALDAGATRIEVTLEGGGKDEIRVVDDGSGMSREDALLAVQRHATSKLEDAEGLFALTSFGFRGEAVPAIASVSRMRIVTCLEGEVEGSQIDLEGGEVVSVEPCGAPKGTSITVRDLFYSVPARRKYLKRPETELGHVADALIRLSLARPDVTFTLRGGGRTHFHSPAGADPKERIAAAIGKDIYPHLIETDYVHGSITVRGYVASPDFSVRGTKAIYTFVNGRFVRDRQLLHAVQNAYSDMLMPGRAPGVVLFIELPPDEVDVNVHPQKLEVRFVDPRGAYDAVRRAISETLRSTPWLQKGESGERAARRNEEQTGGEGVPERVHRIPATSPHGASGAGTPLPFGAPRSFGAAPAALREAAASLWPLPGDEARLRSDAPAEPRDPDYDGEAPGFFRSLRYIGQFAGTYLVCESPQRELVVLDQHAAHERLTFHRLREAWRSREPIGQPFLFPAVIELGIGDAKVLLEHLPALAEIGVELEPFGGTSFALKSIPRELAGADYTRVFADMARELASVGAGKALEEAVSDILATIACHHSVRAHQALSEEEARALLDDLDGIDFNSRCPHGRPVLAVFSIAQIEKGVGRR